MALSHKLELRQSQSLVMTPQLMQAIKLLQLSNLDLVAYVDAELERNPLLERTEGEDGGDGAGDDARRRGGTDEPATTAPDFGDDPPDWMETRMEVDPEAIADQLDSDLANVFPDDHGKPAGETPPALPAESWAIGAVAPADQRRGLQSRGLRRRAEVARRPSRATSSAWRPPIPPCGWSAAC